MLCVRAAVFFCLLWNHPPVSRSLFPNAVMSLFPRSFVCSFDFCWLAPVISACNHVLFYDAVRRLHLLASTTINTPRMDMRAQ